MVERALGPADIRLNFTRPWDLKVKDERLFRRFALSGWAGLRDAYIDGDWESADLEELIFRVLSAGLDRVAALSPGSLLLSLKARANEHLLPPRPHLPADPHQEMPFQFYASFLDPYRQFGPGCYRATDDLAAAQQDRLALICSKLRIGPGDHVLDLGCGWGGFARFAVEHHGCRVTGVTPSREQAKHAMEVTRGLPVEIQEGDFRKLTGRYDKILVSRTFEHLLPKHRQPLVDAMHRSLAGQGRILIETVSRGLPFNGVRTTPHSPFEPPLPSAAEVTAAVQGVFMIDGWESLSNDYVLTLRAWRRNLTRQLDPRQQRHDPRTLRAWDYHFASTTALFRRGERQVSHIVLATS